MKIIYQVDDSLIGYKKILNISEPEEEVNEIMSRVDSNNSGYIDYTGLFEILYISLF